MHVAKVKRSLDTRVAPTQDRMSLEGQVEAIEKAFDDAAALSGTALVHPSNSSLRAEAVLPLMPDLGCWSNTYVQMQFDVDPSLEHVRDAHPKYTRQRVSHAMVKGRSTQDTQGQASQTFVAYLLPKATSAEDPAESQGDDVASHQGEGTPGPTQLEWVREYAYEVKRESEDDAFFFIVQGDCVEFNELSTKMALTRKSFQPTSARPSEIVLRRRKPLEDEERQQKERLERLGSRQRLLMHTPAVDSQEDTRTSVPAVEGSLDGFGAAAD